MCRAHSSGEVLHPPGGEITSNSGDDRATTRLKERQNGTGPQPEGRPSIGSSDSSEATPTQGGFLKSTKEEKLDKILEASQTHCKSYAAGSMPWLLM
ncbi:hypothetical protein NDU88_007237 [Pleurodeles waltl]|uniref:Uncharacterized protein n=1 Tax=Pleurodeles waltl TaxID=8319 RepID=A0AAV7U037_PLEWA|nr:hypothetical protein NDU88_007237 [Pleurodeles waltl]